MILERLVTHPNWLAGLEVALTRPEGVPERREGEDPWEPEHVDRPRRIADYLAWFRSAMDRPDESGLQPVDDGLPSTWDAEGETAERLQRLEARGVLEAAGFALHRPDLAG
jgi:hypothetical protein